MKWIPGELNIAIIDAVNCTKIQFFPLWGKRPKMHQDQKYPKTCSKYQLAKLNHERFCQKDDKEN